VVSESSSGAWSKKLVGVALGTHCFAGEANEQRGGILYEDLKWVD
jgi:hypothetical protein